MVFSRKQVLLLIIGGILLMTGAVLLVPTSSADAQCGSQASSCKNCHEVQAKDPVNADGTRWHESHAFGDFCYICHAGNSQSMFQNEAHLGMVPPLSDPLAACSSCHVGNPYQIAQEYGDILGITVGSSGQVPVEPQFSATAISEAPAASTSGDETGGPDGLVVGDEEVIDYQQRYAETVSGVRPINVGNVIAATLIFAILVGGGAFVVYNERKRGELPMFRKKAPVEVAAVEEQPVIEGVPAEVAALVPQIAKLNPIGLHALKRLLENPEAASELFHSLSKLDPELVKRVRNLDRPTRELLLAMSGD